MITQEQVLLLTEKIYQGGDNFHAKKQGKFWLIGFTNDNITRDGSGYSQLVPESVLLYILSIYDDFERSIQKKIKEAKEDGDCGIVNKTYWYTCGLYDSINVLKKRIKCENCNGAGQVTKCDYNLTDVCDGIITEYNAPCPVCKGSCVI